MIRLYVWGEVPVHRALARLAVDRGALRRLPFGRLVGTARGFEAGSADLHRWFAVVDAGEAFETSPLVRGWDAVAGERARLDLRPLAARGSWGGRRPFAAEPGAWSGPVLSLTHARLEPLCRRRFRQAVGPVAAEVAAAAGLRWSAGFARTPGLDQGTVSVWSSAAAVGAFAGAPQHRAVVGRTPVERWYAEELFARFALVAADGRLDGEPASRLTA